MTMNKRIRTHLVFGMAALLVLGLAGTSTAAEYEKVPILMVHGMGANSSTWYSMKLYLKSNGYDDKLLYTIDMTDNFTLCSDSHLTQISAKVEEIVSKSGFQRIDVIGHSRGGLNLYDYMRHGNGAKRVRNWISIGGANNAWCFGFSETSSSDPTPGDHTSYTSIYSLTDELVAPNIAMIKGARNISIENASHFTLPMDSEVMPHVLKALQGTGLNDGVALSDPGSPSPPTNLKIISSATGP